MPFRGASKSMLFSGVRGQECPGSTKTEAAASEPRLQRFQVGEQIFELLLADRLVEGRHHFASEDDAVGNVLVSGGDTGACIGS